jgi:hypothetical protein
MIKPIKVRVPHPKGGMVIGKVVRYDRGSMQDSPFYVVDVGEYASIKVPAHKVEAENHEQLTKQYNHIFAEVQTRLQEKCFGVETHIDQDGEVI